MATAPNAARAPAARAPRSSRVYVRLTVKERANLDRVARRAGITPSDVVRAAIEPLSLHVALRARPARVRA